MDVDFLEQCIIKGMLTDPSFAAMLSSTFDPKLFQSKSAGDCFDFIKTYLIEYKALPEKTIIANSLNSDDVKEFVSKIESTEFDYVKSYDWLLENTNRYLKEQSIKFAILDSFDVIEKGENLSSIRAIVEAALAKDLKIDLGLNYFDTLAARLKRIVETKQKRIPTYYPQLDEYLCGGLPPYTLTMILARIHAGKSNTMANIAARQVLHGHNVAMFSLEMSEDAFAARFDSIFSLMDINKIYSDTRNLVELSKRLGKIKTSNNPGNLYIKQFPTGTADVGHFRVYLRELRIRGEMPDILYCDYANLMKPEIKIKNGNTYTDVKRISEELRALSYEFEIPIFTVSQLNREGMTIDFEAVDFTNVSESIGCIATADAVLILGRNEDDSVYESEVMYKIVKNRLGGRVGEIDRFYLDSKSLKLYDSSELDLWLNDAKITGDTRNSAGS